MATDASTPRTCTYPVPALSVILRVYSTDYSQDENPVLMKILRRLVTGSGQRMPNQIVAHANHHQLWGPGLTLLRRGSPSWT